MVVVLCYAGLWRYEVGIGLALQVGGNKGESPVTIADKDA